MADSVSINASLRRVFKHLLCISSRILDVFVPHRIQIIASPCVFRPVFHGRPDRTVHQVPPQTRVGTMFSRSLAVTGFTIMAARVNICRKYGLNPVTSNILPIILDTRISTSFIVLLQKRECISIALHLILSFLLIIEQVFPTIPYFDFRNIFKLRLWADTASISSSISCLPNSIFRFSKTSS